MEYKFFDMGEMHPSKIKDSGLIRGWDRFWGHFIYYVAGMGGVVAIDMTIKNLPQADINEATALTSATLLAGIGYRKLYDYIDSLYKKIGDFNAI